jgi:16S rRNA (uracil1498-N3)-methyltransferase
MIRIYQNCNLNQGAIIHLDERASHHLSRVLRVRKEDEIALFNGQEEFSAHIKEIRKKEVVVQISDLKKKQSEPRISICLAQGLARGEKMDFIIQKAVELGVNRIIPLMTEYSNVRLDQERTDKRFHHWQSVIVSACEQSGRIQLPEILPPQPLTNWFAKNKADLCLVLTPHRGEKQILSKLPLPESIVVLVGPEGGLSENEIDQAISAGFIPWNLGERILRTETASVAAVSILQYWCESVEYSNSR